MTVYIWVAHQSEPGMHGKRYTATANNQPPASIKPISHQDQLSGDETGLVYEGAIYSDWQPIGTVAGELFTNSYGEQMVTVTAGAGQGSTASVDDLIAYDWYQEAGNAQQ